MEENIGFPDRSTHCSATPPTAPPSYEEVVRNARDPLPQPNIPPYPVGLPSMPIPSCNQPPNQMTMPLSPNYSGPSEPVNQTTMPPLPNYLTGSHQVPRQLRTQTRYNTRLPASTEVGIIQTVAYSMSPNPIKMSCPTCHASVKTATISDHQPSAHICCIILCLLGCCLCSCLPYCMSSFMSVHHFCPNCKNYIGTWKG